MKKILFLLPIILTLLCATRDIDAQSHYHLLKKTIIGGEGGWDYLSVLDAQSGAVLKTIKLSGAPEFAVSDGKGHVYVNLENTSSVVKIDSKKNRIESTWSVSPGEEPNGISMDVKSQTLFIACA